MSDPAIYTVGWVCAISTEYVAAQSFLDEKHDGAKYVSPNDNNDYTLGRIGKHNVVIAVLPDGEYGISSAAAVARDMLHSFPNVRIGLMVGIGGGAPSKKHDVRLGDIVVSASRDGSNGGVFQYDFGKTIQEQDFRTTGFLNQPPTLLRSAVSGLRAQYESDGHELEEAINAVLGKKPKMRKKYKRPGPESDRLYRSTVVHPSNDDDDLGCASTCGDDLVPRKERDEEDDNPAIHYGLIASANQLMKDALIRDKLAEEKGVLCFEMEAAGLMNHFPCLVIRGICDYSDSHKNKQWQGYAAMAAAAYAKDLLCRIAPNRVEAERKVVDLLSGVQEGVSKILRKQHDDEHTGILKWLTATNPAAQHSDYIKRRQSGTGQWLLESPQFQTWLNATEGRNRTLFCPGMPGAGKTMLTAIVVDHLQTMFTDDPDTGIAYLYCNFRKHSEQNLEELLSGLVMQLIRGRPIPEQITELYNSHKTKGTRPLLSEISNALLSATSALSKVFVIIDALDECQTSHACRTKLLSEVFNLQAKYNVSCFATSRYIPEIMDELEDSTKLEIRSSDDDIRKYLEGHLPHVSGVVGMNPDLQREATDEIVKAANGMFLLAQLRLDSINGIISRKAVRVILSKRSKEDDVYDSAYNGAMERIQGQVRHSRDCAIKVLSWIVCAKRPLTMSELQHALAVEVESDEPEFDKENIPEADEMISVCAGLVTLDEESKIIRLIHYTTQEYFERTRENWFPEVEADIARTCVTYLRYDTFSSGFSPSHPQFQEKIAENPLYDYASRNWGDHVRLSLKIDGTQLVLDFLEDGMKVRSCTQAMRASPRYSDDPQMNGMHLAAHFGLLKCVEAMLPGKNLDVRSFNGWTALSWAAASGYIPIVKLLLDKGADVEGTAWTATPLILAAKFEHFNIAELLLSRGADINKADNMRRTPLSWATETGNIKMIEMLLDEGADINTADGTYSTNFTPLFYAIKKGYVTVVKLLLDRDAKFETRAPDQESPLYFASSLGNEAIVKLLLEKGAQVNAEDYIHRAPITVAAEKGYEAVARILLDNGANPEHRGPAGDMPLTYAAKSGNEGLVKLLLDRGARVEGKDEDNIYSTSPLRFAAERGHEAVVRLLISRGAKIEGDSDSSRPLTEAASEGHETIVRILLDNGAELEGKYGRYTALTAATQRGKEDVVKLLLERGANIEAKGTYGRTALCIAAYDGRENIVKLLLEKGADIEAKDENACTPLMLAAEWGKDAVVTLLLDHGANLEATGKNRATALAAAAERGSKTAVKLLLEKGANIEAKAKHKRTPLMLAAMGGHQATINLLLENGANLEAKDSYFSQGPLSLAAENGHEATVKLLIEKGCDIEVKDEEEQTPLSSAAMNGHVKVVRTLLEKGANKEHKEHRNGQTPLGLAAKGGYKAVVELLLEKGVELEVTDIRGRTPLALAALNGYGIVIKMLAAKGANLVPKDKKGQTPQDLASKKHKSTAKLLAGLVSEKK
ncbi:hypothetical protein TWF281_000182 [Arthrobotrys megalospora]